MFKSVLKLLLILNISGLVMYGISSLNPVFADNSIGISPALCKTGEMSAGGSFVQEYLISRTDGSKTQKVRFELAESSISNWISFHPSNEIIFNAGETQSIAYVKFSIPENAASGLYKTSARVGYVDLEDNDNIIFSPGIRVNFEILVAGNPLIEYLVSDTSIKTDLATNTLLLSLDISNLSSGDLYFEKVIVEISGLTLNSNILLDSEDFDVIPGLSERIIQLNLGEVNLPVGSYTARINLFSKNAKEFEKTVSFEWKDEVLQESTVEEEEDGEVLGAVVKKDNSSLKRLEIVFVVAFFMLLFGLIFFVRKAKFNNLFSKPGSVDIS